VGYLFLQDSNVAGGGDLPFSPTREAIINAIITVESEWKSNAIGRYRERGLMQLTYGAWKDTTKRLKVRWSWRSAFNPERNVIVGSAYYDWLFKRFKGSPTQTWDAIRAYNKGYVGARKNRGWKYLYKVKRALRRGGER